MQWCCLNLDFSSVFFADVSWYLDILVVSSMKLIKLDNQIEAVFFVSKFFWNPILILWAKEACQAEPLNIILKSRCPLTSFSKDVQFSGHPESTKPKWDSKKTWKRKQLPLLAIVQKRSFSVDNEGLLSMLQNKQNAYLSSVLQI